MTIFVLLDTETTGLPFHDLAPIQDQPHIIEFGALLTDGKIILDEINVLIKPPIDITEEITKITGLTNESVAGSPTWAEAFPAVKSFLLRADVSVAHNMPFDKRMVKFACARIGVNLDEFWTADEMCTGQEFRPLWGRMPRLIELYEWTMDKPLEQKHRALDDVMAMFEIFQAHDLGAMWSGVKP